MRIKEIISQHRRDFKAIYECEHCGDEQEGKGYDDVNFHQNVIPKMKCVVCKKNAPDSYRPIATRYDEGFEI